MLNPRESKRLQAAANGEIAHYLGIFSPSRPPAPLCLRLRPAIVRDSRFPIRTGPPKSGGRFSDSLAFHLCPQIARPILADGAELRSFTALSGRPSSPRRPLHSYPELPPLSHSG